MRCGYQSKADLAGGLRAGIGIRVRNSSVDYAFVPRGDFGSSQRLSFTLRFGRQYDELLALRNIEQQYEKGIRYYKKGDLVNAHRQLRNVLLVAPGHELAKEYIARTEIRIDEIQDKNNVKKHLELGKEYFNFNRLGDAQAEFESVLAIDPVNKMAINYAVKIRSALYSVAESLFNRGVKQYYSGEYVLVIETMNKALILVPSHEKAKEYAALAAAKLQKIEQVKLLRLQEEQKARQKRSALVLFNEGMAFYEQGKWENAHKKFSEALVFDPASENSAKYAGLAGSNAAREYIEYGKNAFEEKNYFEAGRFFDKALSCGPKNAEAMKYSVQAKEEISKENSEKAFMCNKEALSAYSRGNKNKAIDLWEKALEFDPSMEEARNSLNRAKKEIAK